MESNVTELYARQMGLLWVRGLVPYFKKSYNDYLTIISGLNLADKDPDRIAHVVTTVINEAKELGESDEWIDQEVRFETMVLFVDARDTDIDIRAGLMRVQINRSEGIDEGLDLYNLRLRRFDSE